MSDLYDRIVNLCELRGINVTTMCTRLNISRGNLTDLKMGRQNCLSAKNLNKIAQYFNVTSAFLLGSEEQKNPTVPKDDGISEEERLLNEQFSKALGRLSLSQKRSLLTLLSDIPAKD